MNSQHVWRRPGHIVTGVLLLGLLFLIARPLISSATDMPPAPSLPADPAPLPQLTPRTITYMYDTAGRLSMANYGGGKLFVYEYDRNGNLVATTDRLSIYLPVALKAAK